MGYTPLSENAENLAKNRYYAFKGTDEELERIYTLIEKQARGEQLTDEEKEFIESHQETWEELCERVSTVLASVEKDFKYWKEKFKELLLTRKALPNSPTLMNAGQPLNQLSACFVLNPNDSMESIFETVKNQAIIQKMGGGTGFGFTRLRSRGSKISTTRIGTASGVVSWLKIFNTATEMIQQGGVR